MYVCVCVCVCEREREREREREKVIIIVKMVVTNRRTRKPFQLRAPIAKRESQSLS